MSLVPKDREVGLQLGIGIGGSSIYLPFGKKNDKKKWHHSITKRKGILTAKDFKPLTLLHQQSQNEQHKETCTSLSMSSIKSTSIKGDGYWQRIWYGDEQIRILRDVDVKNDISHPEEAANAVANAFYVPESIISSIAKEELYTTSDDSSRKAVAEKKRTLLKDKGFLLVDPIIHKQLVLATMRTSIDARLDKEPTKILITVMGETKSELSIQLVDIDGTGYLKSKGTSSVIKFNSKVKHIEIPALEQVLGKDPNLFAVLTGTELIIIRFDRLETNCISYTMFQPLKFSDFEQFAIADIAFNPWNIMEIAIIDIKGNWCIGRLESHKKKPSLVKLLPYFSGSIFDPSELSSWNHIDWINDHKSLVLLNRSKILQLDYLSDWEQEVAEAKTWSELKAYKRVNDQISILLSSREVMLLDTSEENVRRMLSWKHNWDPKDPSLNFNFFQSYKNGQNSIQIFLFSNFVPYLYEISLFYEHKSWIVSSDPVMIKISTNQPKTGISDFEFLVRNPYEIDEEDSSEKHLCIVRFVNSEEILQGFISYAANEVLGSSSNIEEKPRPDLRSNHVDLISHELTQPSDDEQNLFQEFGYQVSEKLNSVIEEWSRSDHLLKVGCLGDFKIYPRKFDNFSEYNSLLEQLINYYKSFGIVFPDVPSLSLLLLNERHENWASFYNRMLVCWDHLSTEPETVCKDVVLDLSLILTTFQEDTSTYNMFATTSTGLSNELEEILSIWDDNLDDCNMDSSSLQPGVFSSATFPSQSSQIPVIRSSQPTVHQKRTTTTSQQLNQLSIPTQGSNSIRDLGLPASIAPAFSLGSHQTFTQPMPRLSHAESSQKQRRKKKKVGGFN